MIDHHFTNIWRIHDLRPAIYIILHVLYGHLIPKNYIQYEKFLNTCYFETIFLLNYTYIHGKVGCKRVWTGANGCAWVRMGALGCRGLKRHRNKANRDKNGRAWHVYYPYGRGNFPGHHVSTKTRKNVCMTPDGCAWGLCECFGAWGHGETGKQVGEKHKWGERVVFCMRGHGNKTTTRMWWWSQRPCRTTGGNAGESRVT